MPPATPSVKCHQRTPSSALPILEHFWFPAFLQLRICARLLFRVVVFALYPLSCPQHFTLQVETSSLLRIVDIEEFFESFHHILHIRLPILRRLHVEDLAGLLERQTVGCKLVRSSALGLGFGVLLRGAGLLVGFREGSPEDSGAGDNDFCYYSVRLLQISE